MRELNKVHLMDCIEFLEGIPDNTIDSCVTDPPYGLEFMGKKWNKLGTGRLISDRDDWNWQAYRGNTGTDPLANKPRFGPVMTDSVARNEMQQFHYEWSQLVFRALKPGAHILAFSGTRTYHRLACAVEDARFEIRDMVEWFYGSGFPKGRNISKALDKRAGFNQKIIGIHTHSRGACKGDYERIDKIPFATDENDGSMSNPKQMGAITQPVTKEAKQWNGWNTVLKPAHEPILLGRKPISEKSVEENMLRWGTGAINEGACRIAVNPDVNDIGERYTKRNVKATVFRNYPPEEIAITGVLPSGRYPANLIFSHHPDCRLIQKGKTITVKSIRKRDTPRMGRYGIYGGEQSGWSSEYDYDLGNPEVWACVPDCPVRMLNEQSGQTAKGHWPRGHLYGFGEHIGNGGFDYTGVGRYAKDSGGAARFFYCAKPSIAERNAGLDGERNLHITVKPLAIMRWLVRLVTRPSGIVLDPFLGSGTTAIAAELEGFNWLGCDNNKEYCEIARRRIKALGKNQTTRGE